MFRHAPSRFILSLAAAIASAAAHAEPICSHDIPVEKTCEITLSALHPTQSAVGLIQVEERAVRMKGIPNLDAITRKRPVPVVQGPDGDFYLTDSHHLTSVLVRIGASKVIAQVIGRLDDPKTFWQEMETRHWVYLYDTKGKRIAPSALPKRIGDMADDPYRALAGYAEDAGYFRKTDAYFMEFEWARYLGSRMDWRPVDRMNLLEALQAAERLACQPEAKELPGYAGPCRP